MKELKTRSVSARMARTEPGLQGDANVLAQQLRGHTGPLVVQKWQYIEGGSNNG